MLNKFEEPKPEDREWIEMLEFFIEGREHFTGKEIEETLGIPEEKTVAEILIEELKRKRAEVVKLRKYKNGSG